VQQSSNVKPIFVTVRDAGLVLGVKPWSVYQLIKDNEIESVKKENGRRAVLYSSLEDYAAKVVREASA